MMIAAEFVFMLAGFLSVAGMMCMTFAGRINAAAALCWTAAAGLGLWVGLASYADRPVVAVTYHPINKQYLEDGTSIDVVVLSDYEGQAHVLNLNQRLGVAVPDDGGEYTLARMKYAEDKFGLWIGSRSKYKVVPKDQTRP